MHTHTRETRFISPNISEKLIHLGIDMESLFFSPWCSLLPLNEPTSRLRDPAPNFSNIPETCQLSNGFPQRSNLCTNYHIHIPIITSDCPFGPSLMAICPPTRILFHGGWLLKKTWLLTWKNVLFNGQQADSSRSFSRSAVSISRQLECLFHYSQLFQTNRKSREFEDAVRPSTIAW